MKCPGRGTYGLLRRSVMSEATTREGNSVVSWCSPPVEAIHRPDVETGASDTPCDRMRGDADAGRFRRDSAGESLKVI